MTPCDYYDKAWMRCNGTKERDLCSCGGDKEKCTHYPEVKEKAIKEAAKTNYPDDDFTKFVCDIMDHAMVTRNCCVCIYFGDYGVSVKVYPTEG